MLLNFDFAMREVDENGELKVMSNILLKISIQSSFKPVEFNDYGVITDGGNKAYIKGFTHYEVDKISDEEFVKLMNDFDDIEAPPGPYKIQPENQGNLFGFLVRTFTLNLDTGFHFIFMQVEFCGYQEHLAWENQPQHNYLESIMAMSTMRGTALGA